ncbi:MAG: HAMP domain-containing protein [Desulfomonilaceae bacterium]
MTSQPPRDQPFSGRGRHPFSPSGKRRSPLLRAVERNKVLLFFCLLAVTAVVVDMKFVFDVTGEMTKMGNVQAGNPVSEKLANDPIQADLLDYVRSRMSLILGVTILCFGSMIYLYVYKIHRPLKYVTRTAKEMSNGNLSTPIQSHGSDEVEELAEVINDLAANYQEVLLLTGTAVGKSSSAVERIERVLNVSGKSAGQEELQEHIGLIKRDLEMLGSVVKDFEFYQTHFDGRKVVPTTSGPRVKK